jgi:hypothetical protein
MAELLEFILNLLVDSLLTDFWRFGLCVAIAFLLVSTVDLLISSHIVKQVLDGVIGITGLITGIAWEIRQG